MNFQEQERTIWLDGRPHPPDLAPHTFAGFSTATWDGNMLNVYTDRLKESYLRRNGLPRSSKATFTEHWVRHGNYLTVITAITDPAFLTEPLVRSQNWVLDPNQRIGQDVCEYGPEVPAPLGSPRKTIESESVHYAFFRGRYRATRAVTSIRLKGFMM
jgi:hypothetical protein